MGFTSIDSDLEKTNSFNVSPSFGYFIIDNLAITLYFNYEYKNSTFKQRYLTNFDPASIPTNITIIQNTTSIVPNLSYFFSKGKARPYANAGIGLANVTEKQNSSNKSTTVDGVVWNIGGRLAYFISKSISLDSGIGYTEKKLQSK